ncbi:CAP domain-containing protein [Exiguobacterium qingdaonense]|uniref:CAP domain-containing protein n=1 Tax=Exiguobacterium qingdaonense TaxID=2751251 RepID=UPI001BE60A3D|nr:CAP domain-containing protein [Exiguobacterium qingdaonense]
MKKNLSFLLTIILTLGIISSPFSVNRVHAYYETSVNTTGYVTKISQLNVRQSPSMSAKRLALIPRDGSMRVRTSFQLDGMRWYKIQWGNGYAYLPAKYVRLSTAEVKFTKTTYVKPSSVYLKSRPLTTSSGVKFVRQGAVLDTISYRYTGTTRWYKVRYGTHTGYILAKHVRFTSPVNVLTETNVERKAVGLSLLDASSEANRVAQVRADEMARTGQFSHTLKENGTPGDTLDAYGVSYRGWGENIYKGSSDPVRAVDAWMNSSGHRANILKAHYTHLGIGKATDKKGSTIHVQIFLTK